LDPDLEKLHGSKPNGSTTMGSTNVFGGPAEIGKEEKKRKVPKKLRVKRANVSK
jgi:hypothetical protein